MSIDLSALAAEITSAVRSYTQDVSDAIGAEVDDAATKILKEIKHLAPKRTQEYSKGFKKVNDSLPGNRKYVIWNKKYPWLVHLLEMGHAKRGGTGRVQAYPHMRPAYDKYADQMVENIKNIIRNGG